MFKITNTNYSHSERAVHMIFGTECFYNFLLEVSQIWYNRTIEIQVGKNNWNLETCRKSLRKTYDFFFSFMMMTDFFVHNWLHIYINRIASVVIWKIGITINVPSYRNLLFIKKMITQAKYGKMWKNKRKSGKFVNCSCWPRVLWSCYKIQLTDRQFFNSSYL